MDKRVARTAWTIDLEEVARFDGEAETWWSDKGAARWLHRYNAVRVPYIRDAAVAALGLDAEGPHALKGIRVLDIGCGGGVLCEPLAALGANVVGADPAQNAIAVARRHADEMSLSIDYRAVTAESLVEAGERFDVVTAMEVIEHVADPNVFLEICAALVRPGGLFVLSTINRTRKSYAYAIVAAEYVLRLLPRGTHDWDRFVTPLEIGAALAKHDAEVTDVVGVTMSLMRRTMQPSRDASVNYLLTARKAS